MKQRKKEHEEMHPWYVYQSMRATKEKWKPESAADGKVRRERDGKSHRWVCDSHVCNSSSRSIANTYVQHDERFLVSFHSQL